MKAKRGIAAAALATALAVAIPAMADDRADAIGETVKKMQENVARMQEQMARLASAKSDDERRKIAAEHFETMRENMLLMQGAQTGDAACPYAAQGVMGYGMGPGMMGYGMMGPGMMGYGMGPGMMGYGGAQGGQGYGMGPGMMNYGMVAPGGGSDGNRLQQLEQRLDRMQSMLEKMQRGGGRQMPMR